MVSRIYAAAEYRFGVRTSLQDVSALLDRYLAPLRVPGTDEVPLYAVAPTENGYRISVDGAALGEASSVAWAIEVLLQHVYEEAVRRTRRFRGVHAAAASWRGRGLLLTAPMDSGKTTLVTGLVRAGFDYLTDEVALIEVDTGLLHPFPKALTLEPPSIALMPDLERLIPPEFAWPQRLRYHFNPEEIRPGSVGRPCPVSHVIAPRYVSGGATALREMTRAEAVVVLAENALNLPSFGGTGFRALASLSRGARCFWLTIGDLEGAVEAVAGLVAAQPEGPATMAPAGLPSET